MSYRDKIHDSEFFLHLLSGFSMIDSFYGTSGGFSWRHRCVAITSSLVQVWAGPVAYLQVQVSDTTMLKNVTKLVKTKNSCISTPFFILNKSLFCFTFAAKSKMYSDI